jgi:hypothetical protein
VLQKSKNGLRLIFREKASQATIADRCALKRATEVAGEFIAIAVVQKGFCNTIFVLADIERRVFYQYGP